MNVIDALNSRFTVRAFEPDPVHKGTILKILDAATRAPHRAIPSHGNSLLLAGTRWTGFVTLMKNASGKGCRAAPIYRHRSNGPPLYKSVWTNSRPHALNPWA